MAAVGMDQEDLALGLLQLRGEILEKLRVERVAQSAHDDRDEIGAVGEHDLRNHARPIIELLGGGQDLAPRLRRHPSAGPVRPRHRRLRDPRQASNIG
jgi:hypothetical protein